ncbi:MAG TPA: hypothetical protein VKQ27_08760 [Acetobacteraceae bacterium]|nr:hypothetical protein [Acetobacteraceae bacterium]
MHHELRKAVTAEVRRHIAEGDCPTKRSYNIETLENVIDDLTRTEAAGGSPKRGDKIKWVRALDRRPLAVSGLEYVTVASWGLPGIPLVVTLQEVAGSFSMGWFDRTEATTGGERLRDALDGFVDALTSGRNNPPTVLSINHDVLRACLIDAEAALAQPVRVDDHALATSEVVDRGTTIDDQQDETAFAQPVQDAGVPWGQVDPVTRNNAAEINEARRLLKIAGDEMIAIEPNPSVWVSENSALRAIVHLGRRAFGRERGE